MAAPTALSDEGAPHPEGAVGALAPVFAVSPLAQALFDATGRCVAATADFTRRAAAAADAAGRLSTEFLASGDLRSVALDGIAYRLMTLPAAEPLPAAESGPAPDTGDRPAAKLLLALLNAVPAIINAKDPSSRYLFMNAYQAQIYGTTPEAAIGRSAADLLGAGYGDYTAALDHRAIASGRPIPFYEESYAGADGVVRQWLTTKAPLVGDDGVPAGVATIGFDIGDRKSLERSLMETKRTAEAASQAKTLFLAQISHELRTPLNAIIGFTEMMAQEIFGPLGAAQYKGYSGDVLKAARHLLGIITDMLDVTRLDAGALALDIVAVAPGEVVTEAGRMVALPASTKHVQLRHYVEPGLPRLKADPRRLRQALINLIANAVKFTPEGGTVSFGACRAEDGIELYVEDSGIGMSPADLATALMVFGRVREGYAKSQDGTGIGLPLAKALIERHGGRFLIDSKPGAGTKIRALFPPACLAREGDGA
jgi:PAS domain S-box-containing protein